MREVEGEPRVLGVKDLFPPAFYRAYNDFITERCETICMDGGRGSVKSTAAGYFTLFGLERDRRIALAAKKAGDRHWRRHLTHAVCYRKVAGTLADSCFSQLQWCADKLGLTSKYRFTKTPLKIERIGTGQRILFRGLDDPQKSRSIKMPFGYIKYLHWEELTEFDGIEEVQDVTRSVQRGGHKFMTFYTYNPPETSSNWVNYALAKLEAEDPTFHRYHSDYRSVNPNWLGEKFFRDAEILRRINERAYRHIYLGEITGNGGTVFPNVKRVRLTDDDIARFDNIRWGADFGLRDPTVLLGMHYDSSRRRLIIFDEVYHPDMTLDEIETEFKRHHFGFEYIMGDSASAQLIVSLRSRGVPIIPVEKYGDFRMLVTKWLQSCTEILIDDRRCPNTYREFIESEYEKDKAGEFTGRIPDGNDHGIDSCRYAVSRLAKYDSIFN